MKQINLEVLIPVKGRKTIARTIDSLIKINLIDLITIVTEDDFLDLEKTTVSNPKVRIIKLAKQAEFSKSYYLNQGIKNSLGKFILISDADIIWNSKTIKSIYNTITSQNRCLVCIAHVEETKKNDLALKRPRLTPVIRQLKPQHYKLQIVSDILSTQRPGCGLICTERHILLDLGGYNEHLQGWGWEDRDLLIRGQILGYKIIKVGTVTHLSHGDNLRNRSLISPLETRNNNILTSCQMLSEGKVKGSLANYELDSSLTIEIEIPSFLNNCKKR